MDKNAIKKFATWARCELIARVAQKAEQYGITKDEAGDIRAESVNGHLLSKTERRQRAALMEKISRESYQQVMEEAAYTWFNRFCALRFLEVNHYLPSHVRVFTDEQGAFKPEILAEAIHLELDGLDMEKVYALKDANDDEALYKYLLITQCNALNKILPQMFQTIADYTELLFPDNLLREGSVLEQMVTLIPEEDWLDQVQIIGWLYQYYNSEPKDKVFANLKKNIKIGKNDIPAATQLFTPDWIVRYMVENSLGRLWLEGHPSETLKAQWRYYLDEAPQDPEVEEQLEALRREAQALRPEDIRVMDPCMGSGHILVYMFDVLVKIYAEYGYSERDAVRSILENNLYGLDIDDRAAQLAYFSVMMKARKYDSRFFRRGVQPHVYAVPETAGEKPKAAHPFELGEKLFEAFRDGKEYGSLLETGLTMDELNLVKMQMDDMEAQGDMLDIAAVNTIRPLWNVAFALAQKYDAVVTNPPYMGASGMGTRLSNFVKKKYPDSKSDLFAVFMERCGNICKKDGYASMVTMQAWMFLSSFEKIRKKLLKNYLIKSLVQIGYNSFPEMNSKVAQGVAFALQQSKWKKYRGTFLDLSSGYGQSFDKECAFFSEKQEGVVYMSQIKFNLIPGCPISFKMGNSLFNAFETGKPMAEIAPARLGLFTGDNDHYLKQWSEVNFQEINFNLRSFDKPLNDAKWVPHNKGGNYRKWYGNNELVLLFQNDGEDIKKTGSLQGTQFYFKEGITWTGLTTALRSYRYCQGGFTFDINKGPMLFSDKETMLYLMGLLNSTVGQTLVKIINPTISVQVGDMNKIPILKKSGKINEVCDRVNIAKYIAKKDWDSLETSWDFEEHPLVKHKEALWYHASGTPRNYFLFAAYKDYKYECELRFNRLKEIEEELNRIFIDIYGLQDELTPDVDDKDVTVYRIFDSKADVPESMGSSRYVLTKQDVVKSFISYAVGCMFGRYSLDVPGLAYAGGAWDADKYKTFPADRDNILPICDDDYFDDDIVGRFVRFVEVVFGSHTLEENLKFIADALGGRGTPRDVIRSYFLADFFKDHCKTYQKRPIYWLFDSGKKNGFKALIYMHRYQPDTLARIRTDYVHEQQNRCRALIETLDARARSASTSERVKLHKQLDKLKAQQDELHTYEEKIHHLADQMIQLDLDDGVKKNYGIFEDVLAKIK